MGKEDSVDARGTTSESREAHGHSTTGIDDEDLVADEDSVRGSGPIGIGRRKAGAEQGTLHRRGRGLRDGCNPRKCNQE